MVESDNGYSVIGIEQLNKLIGCRFHFSQSITFHTSRLIEHQNNKLQVIWVGWFQRCGDLLCSHFGGSLRRGCRGCSCRCRCSFTSRWTTFIAFIGIMYDDKFRSCVKARPWRCSTTEKVPV